MINRKAQHDISRKLKVLNYANEHGNCSGQVFLATILYSFQYFSSATFGTKPSLY